MRASLCHLVQSHDAEGVKTYFDDTRKIRGANWWLENAGDSLSFYEAGQEAALLGDRKIIELFLNEGLDVHRVFIEKDKELSSPLICFAAKVNNLKLVQALVGYGTNADRKEGVQRAFETALEHGSLDVLRYCFEQGFRPDWDFLLTYEGISAISAAAIAALSNQEAAVELLMNHEMSACTALDSCSRWLKRRVRKYNKAVEHNGVSDKEKKQHIDNLNIYKNAVRVLLDNSFGKDLATDTLKELKSISLEGLNFVGVSHNGVPITDEMLDELELPETGKALFICRDIEKVEDEERRATLQRRLSEALATKGKLIDKNGVVNLVPLEEAAQRGDLEAVQARLSGNVPEYIHELAVRYSPKSGNLDVVRLLVEHAKVDRHSLVCAFHTAIRDEEYAIADYLLSLIDPIDASDDRFPPLLHDAARRHNRKEVELLLSWGANMNLSYKGKRPFDYAFESQPHTLIYTNIEENLDFLRFLLENGANPNLHNGFSPLSDALRRGFYNSVALLLPWVNEETIKNVFGFPNPEKGKFFLCHLFFSTPLEEVKRIINLLLEVGADINAKDSPVGETLIYRLISHRAQSQSDENNERYSEILNFLLEKGADLTITCGEEGLTPLHHFIRYSKDPEITQSRVIELIDHLLKYVPIDIRSENGLTPLHEAVLKGNLPVVKYLIEKRADVNALSNEEETPLHFAGNKRSWDVDKIVKALIEGGSDVNSIDCRGQTPLESLRLKKESAHWYDHECYDRPLNYLEKVGGRELRLLKKTVYLISRQIRAKISA